MEKWSFALIGLLIILFLGSILYRETFVDSSGATVTLSVSDVLSLIGTSAQASASQTKTPSQQPIIISGGTAAGTQSTLDKQFYNSLKDSIVSDVRQSIHDELLNINQTGSQDSQGGLLSQSVVDDGCMNSIADSQGADFMKYIPGKNPADYIRKDSIPCYACSLK